jgi:hypothetical protein
MRSLVPIQVRWNYSSFNLSYPGGSKIFRGSPESFAKFLRKLGAKEGSTTPRSSRTWTYKEMVDAIMRGKDPNIYVFSNDLANIPQMIINEENEVSFFKVRTLKDRLEKMKTLGD